MAYQIYTSVNYAETSRDADDIRIDNIDYKEKLEDALDVANKFIKEKFFHKDTKLKKYNNNYAATDFCSWGKTIVVEQINIEKLCVIEIFKTITKNVPHIAEGCNFKATNLNLKQMSN